RGLHGARNVAVRYAGHRESGQRGDWRLSDVCLDENLRLAADALSYVSRWITPEGAPRRFDTRFFVGAAPADQTPLHDATETIAHEWVRPADALERHRLGDVDLMFPTLRTLEWLATETSVTEVLTVAASGVMAP